ncbi:MAG: T9SS type A sorting domain-containing protein [Cryomorphaceae bacterium]
MKFMRCAFIILLIYPLCINGQVQNNGNLRMHAGSNVGLFGNFSNNGNFTNNQGTLHVVGSTLQKFNGTNIIHTSNLTMNKTSNALQLDNVLQIAGVLTFTDGSILTDHADVATEYVEFLDGATYAEASDRSHIDGVVRKTGNEAFAFPVGDNSILRTIGITAPALGTDQFTAYYAEENPDGLYSSSSLDVNLDHVSACEYWMLNRTGGNSNVAVTLSWAPNSCGVDNLCDLQISRWDGAQWKSAGNGGTTGTTESGSLASGKSCSVPEPLKDFSPFTLGSSSRLNPLPISLISFDAAVCESSVCLTWQTESEINNDYFTVEKSNDGFIWSVVKEVDGAGNSQTTLDYSTVDESPYSGLSYYRLKQTDFDGAFEYSSIKSVHFENPYSKGLTIYPNPTRDILNIKGFLSGVNSVNIYNSIGQDVTSSVTIISRNETALKIDISPLTPGVYHLKTNYNSGSIIKL